MAINFFDQQQDARRATRLLIWLFLLALAVLVLLVNLGVFSLWYLFALRTSGITLTPALSYYLSSQVCWITSLVTLIVFISGSIKRNAQLRRDSTSLAQLVNATEITYAMAADDEKQLINVVEEMAVASGMPPPRLFVMRNEAAINAFVTGLAPQQLLVVTQGALDQLSRDELQGVIGHEFSHLLNGDTRLNLRMLILLAGLLSVGRLGLYLMTAGLPDRELKSRIEFQRRIGADISNSSNDRGNGLFAIAGLILVIAGYAGLFIGRLIKAAIGRQREALADASAQQFTRNPAGLAGALIKIKNGSSTLLAHPFAEDINHMCFGDTVRIHWRRLLATHPDIDTRLNDIDPSWVARARVRNRQQNEPARAPTPTPSLGYAQSLITNLPPTLTQALHDANGASLVIYALLMDVTQQKFLPAVKAEDKQKLPVLVEQISALGQRTRLPLIDLALPALQRLSNEEARRLLDNIDWLIKADGQVSLFEYLLRQLVRHRLTPAHDVKVDYTRLDQLAGSVQLLLSILIHHASRDNTAQQQLFQRFATPLLPAGRLLLPLEKCSLKALTQALQQLRRLSPLLKQSLLDTCADIILADNKVQVEELELLRLICVLADAPVPTLALEVQAC